MRFLHSVLNLTINDFVLFLTLKLCMIQVNLFKSTKTILYDNVFFKNILRNEFFSHQMCIKIIKIK